MPRSGYFHWHNILLVVLIAALAADAAFGLDAVLNTISIIVTAAVVIALIGASVLVVVALFWITIRDLIEDIKSDRLTHTAWRWKFVALAGILGILADGAVGTWNAYQKHIQFSASVEAIPFSGVPVFLLLASYLFKWAEQYFEGRKGSDPVKRPEME